jgi:hypothetical protein
MHDLAIRRPSVIDQFDRDISAPTLPVAGAIGVTASGAIGGRGVFRNEALMFVVETHMRLEEGRQRVDAVLPAIATPPAAAAK